MEKYIGTYTLYFENPEHTVADYFNEQEEPISFLLGKYGIQIYRYSKDKLCILFVTINASNTLVPKIKDLGIILTPLVTGDQESIYSFEEKENSLSQIHNLAKLSIKGKNEQLKKYKKLVKENKTKKKSKSK